MHYDKNYDQEVKSKYNAKMHSLLSIALIIRTRKVLGQKWEMHSSDNSLAFQQHYYVCTLLASPPS